MSIRGKHGLATALFLTAFVLLSSAFFLFISISRPMMYLSEEKAAQAEEVLPPKKIATHIATPIPVKALYMSACYASDTVLREKLMDFINETELNAIVIDIKDYSGHTSYTFTEPELADTVSKECFNRDMPEFLEELHRHGIYVIGRVTVFQDPLSVSKHPDLAVKRESDQTKVWKDRKGISYIDPGAREAWDYFALLARASYDIGFDEINFDYIRFPSDGDMNDIYYPFSEAAIAADPGGGKSLVLEGFFEYLNRELKPTGMVLSADLFGMTTTNTDDLNIGQVLEKALPYFDYIAPMVYPSHYPSGFIGIAKPATKPYEVIRYSMDRAVARASTTPWKLRPWLQDFSLGADYTPEMVKAQIQAVYDSGLASWMLWNASNRYTREALDAE